MLYAVVLAINLYNTGSRIQLHLVKSTEVTNLEYQDGGHSAFPTCQINFLVVRKVTESENSA